jgi:TRAP-type C4-dicarboxylate transport system substrate-binding protein
LEGLAGRYFGFGCALNFFAVLLGSVPWRGAAFTRCRSKFPPLGALAVITATLLAASSGIVAAQQQKIKINFAHIGPSSSPVIAGGIGPLAKALEATGKVEFVWHGGGSAYSNPLKYPELLENGIIDMAYGAQQFHTGQFPLNLLLFEPFLMTDHVKASATYMDMVRKIPQLKAEFGKMHLMQVGFTPHDAIHSIAPMRTPDDFKGKRVMASHPAVVDVLRFLGASVVVLPPGAQYENLQKGVVEASSSTQQSVAAFKLAEVTKYHLIWKVSPQLTFLAMNKEKYESLPPDVKAVIDRYSTREAAVELAEVWSAGATIGEKQIKESGGEIYTMPGAERKALKERVRAVVERRVAEAAKKNPLAPTIFETISKALEQN